MTEQAEKVLKGIAEWEFGVQQHDTLVFYLTPYDYAYLEDTLKSVYYVEKYKLSQLDYWKIQIRCKPIQAIL